MSRFLEDFRPGQRFVSPPRRVSHDDIVAFARTFDPQPFHLDERAAARSIFGGLVASGWHTAALTMSLALQARIDPAGGFVGLGVDELSWPHPVRAGDCIALVAEVESARPMRSRHDAGVLRLRMTTSIQRGDVVLSGIGNIVVMRREAVPATVRHARMPHVDEAIAL